MGLIFSRSIRSAQPNGVAQQLPTSSSPVAADIATQKKQRATVRKEASPPIPEKSLLNRESSGASLIATGPVATSHGNRIRRQMLQGLRNASSKADTTASVDLGAPTPTGTGDFRPMPDAPIAQIKQRLLATDGAVMPGAYSVRPGRSPLRRDTPDYTALYANRLSTTQQPSALSNAGVNESADGSHALTGKFSAALPIATPVKPGLADRSNPYAVQTAIPWSDDSSVSSDDDTVSSDDSSVASDDSSVSSTWFNRRQS